MTFQTSGFIQSAGLIQSEHSALPRRWLLCTPSRPPARSQLGTQGPTGDSLCFTILVLQNTSWSIMHVLPAKVTVGRRWGGYAFGVCRINVEVFICGDESMKGCTKGSLDRMALDSSNTLCFQLLAEVKTQCILMHGLKVEEKHIYSNQPQSNG